MLISAGFDAYVADPLAGMRVSHAGFGAIARRVRALADRACSGRIVAVLEGGYDLDGLAGGMTATLAALTADAVAPEPVQAMPAGLARVAIEATLAAHAAAGRPLDAVRSPTPEARGHGPGS